MKQKKKVKKKKPKANPWVNRKIQGTEMCFLTGDVIKKMKTKQLPARWKEVELGKVCDVRDGTHDSPKYVNEGYPLITSKNLAQGYIDFSNINLITKEDFDNINKRSKVDIGDIIMPMIGTIGNPIIVQKTEEFAIKNVALIKFNNKIILNTFVKLFLSSSYFDRWVNRINRGGTQKFVALKDIRSIKIPLPPPPTQKKIVQILEQAEQLKQKREQADKLTNEYLKSVFNEVFGDLVRNEKNWPIRKLLEITKEIQPGFAYGRFNEEGGLIHLRPFNINNQGYILFNKIKYIPTTEINSEKYFLLKGDVVINTTNSKELVGKTALFNIDEECSFSNHMTKIRADNSLLNSYYLWFTLNRYWGAGLFKPLIKSWVNQVGIDSALLKSLKIPLPPLSLQKKFASIVQKVEKIKEAQKKSKQEIDDLFNALMQKTFKGELVR